MTAAKNQSITLLLMYQLLTDFVFFGSGYTTFTKKWFEFPNFEPALAKNWENSIQPTYFVGYNFPEPKI